ncbi:transglycosylase [Streptococcus pluranimalium]|uniref:transglycosylase n=1 Tax=Streptococcus pluranimalium TaxID=82348 RepID=UPI0039FC28E3
MKRHLNKNKLKKKTLYLLLPFLAFGAILGATGVFSSNSYFSKAESEEIEIKPTQETSSQASSSEVTKTSSTSESSASEPTASSSNEAPTTSEAPVSEVDAVATQEAAAVDANSEQLVVSEVAYNAQVPATPVQQTHYYAAPTSKGVLANGNTAGKDGAYAAAQMAAATGVDQATWEHIIARESNGQVGARNASGASGLFQTMPGWGSTATIQDQINSAINAYNAQGLSAWGY